MSKLSAKQAEVLRQAATRPTWAGYVSLYGCHARTVKSLIRRELLYRPPAMPHLYKITEAGRAALSNPPKPGET